MERGVGLTESEDDEWVQLVKFGPGAEFPASSNNVCTCARQCYFALKYL